MAGLPLTREDPALGKLHVLAAHCEEPRVTDSFGNERPPVANTRMRDAPWGQCLNHAIDPKTDKD